MVATINADPGSRLDLEARPWSGVGYDGFAERLQVLGFNGSVRRRAAAIGWRRGSLMFQHSPRFYHSFKPE